MKIDAVQKRVIERDAIDHVIDSVLTVAGGVDSQSTEAAKRDGTESTLRRCNGARGLLGNVENVSSIEGHLLDRATINHVPH